MGANVLVEFENIFLMGAFFLKLGAKNYFGIEKISYFGNYMDPRLKKHPGPMLRPNQRMGFVKYILTFSTE